MPFTAHSTRRAVPLLAGTIIALAACNGSSSETFLIHAGAFGSAVQSPSRDDHRPSPALTPGDVVRIQLEALQRNDEEDGDGGIATVFQFASPANRSMTGPFDRFVELVKTPEYRPMLNHRRAEPGPLITSGDLAEQRVLITTGAGDRVAYVFVLARQREGAYAGCWMTEGVLREPTASQQPPWDIRKA
jgi:hypothetical protein